MFKLLHRLKIVKTWKNLWLKILDPVNLLMAADKANSHKSDRMSKALFNVNLAESIMNLRERLKARCWIPSPYVEFDVVENGKKRRIEWIRNHEDHVVQQAIVQVLLPLFMKKFILDTYSGLPGRGPDTAIVRLRHMLNLLNYYTDYHYWCYEADVHHYYPTTRGDMMMRFLEHHIGCDWTLWILNTIIMNHPIGRPLGDPLSPLLMNVYLMDIDVAAKQVFKLPVYVRYCDNFVSADRDKGKMNSFQDYLHEQLDARSLVLNANEQIYPCKRGPVDFIGYWFDGYHVRLRKSSERKVRHAYHRFEKHQTTEEYQRLSSYWGMCKRLPAGDKFWSKVTGGRTLKDIWKHVKELREEPSDLI